MFYSPDDFPYLKALQCGWHEILREYHAISNNLELWPEARLYNHDWRVYGLFDFPGGAALPDQHSRCPVTSQLITEHVPNHGAAGFSRLGSGCNIVAHEGYQGDFLRCHLGLVVPEGDCAICVGGETRAWVPGELLIFDDRITHSAWNLTSQSRVVLLLDFVP